jgi:hypothetical protein
MPFLATTRAGVEHAVERLEGRCALWFGTGVLSQGEISALWERGLEVSVFDHEVQTHEAIDCASSTLREHHPGEPVWVEVKADDSNPQSANVAQAFLWREYIVGVVHRHNALVEVCEGEHLGTRGSLVSLIAATPEPVYLVELESGHDVHLVQSALRSADA